MPDLPERDLYEILEVGPEAKPNEIKQAFRRLTKQHHPDANPTDPNASARFRELLTAYRVLSSRNARTVYDWQRRKRLEEARRHSLWEQMKDIFAREENSEPGMESLGFVVGIRVTALVLLLFALAGSLTGAWLAWHAGTPQEYGRALFALKFFSFLAVFLGNNVLLVVTDITSKLSLSRRELYFISLVVTLLFAQVAFQESVLSLLFPRSAPEL